MRCVFFFIAIVTQALCFSDPQKIVMLYGGGSVGKTSLCREVSKLDPSWCVINEGVPYRKRFLELFVEEFPEEMAIISKGLPDHNIISAIMRAVPLFYDSATEEERYAVVKAIKFIRKSYVRKTFQEPKRRFVREVDALILETLQDALSRSDTVLLDGWYLSASKIKRAFPDVSLVKILVFSSLSSVLEKLDKRNREAFSTGNSYSYRSYNQIIPGYIACYQVSNTSTNALYCCEKRELVENFATIKSNLQKRKSISRYGLRAADLTLEELDEYARRFIPEDLNDDDLVFISPVADYHSVIHTHNQTPNQAASEFLGLFRD